MGGGRVEVREPDAVSFQQALVADEREGRWPGDGNVEDSAEFEVRGQQQRAVLISGRRGRAAIVALVGAWPGPAVARLAR